MAKENGWKNAMMENAEGEELAEGGAGPVAAQWWGRRPVATSPPPRTGLDVVL